ncbi:MAG TPA: aspartyl protease family protein [Candidatus Baltobacteraceae bacterium]|nr:aspartyl protease family protein [Candidatus Baltobacteraceae bacterium]
MLDVILAVAIHARIPFQLIDNRIVMAAGVNGKPGFAMILDTGTNGVALTPQAAARLHLRLTPGPAIGGAGAGRAKSYQSAIRTLRLGGYSTGKLPVLVMNLDTIRKVFRFPRLDGIIGYDAITARYTGIDMDSRTITISSTRVQAPLHAQLVPFAVQDGLIVVNAAIDGVHGDAIVDTGDRSAFTVFQRFAAANGFYALKMRRRNIVTGYGIGGPIRGDVFESAIDVFGFHLPHVVTRAPLGNAGVFSTAEQLGSVGDGILRHFDTIFDSKAHTLRVWQTRDAQAQDAPPSATVPALPRHGVFGAVLGNGTRGAWVSHVFDGTAAAAAGIRAGDVIVALERVPTPDAAAFLAQIHRYHAGDRVALNVLRGGVERPYEAVLGAPADEHAAGLTTNYGAISVDGTLRRTLITTPATLSGKLPAMLLMGGIGCYSVDVAANAQDPYMNLSHDVSRAGFVTMRVEKSGVGDSEGPPCKSVDFQAELRAYVAALQVLRNDPHVDASRIYLFGHSIGSIEAPLLANAQPVAGVVVAEAVGRNWPEYELRNTRRQLELTGEAPADVDAALIGKQACLVRLLLLKQPEPFIERSEPECKVHNGVYPVDPPYMQQVAAVNGISQWSRIDVPVLAVYGTSDFVTEQADHERIVDVVSSRHAGSATFVSIKNMDHLLFSAPSPKAAYDAFSAGTPRVYDRDLSDTVIRWLCAHTHCSAANI